jgi:hypothetical protein
MIILAIALAYSDPIGKIITKYEREKVVHTAQEAKKTAEQVTIELQRPYSTAVVQSPCKR